MQLPAVATVLRQIVSLWLACLLGALLLAVPARAQDVATIVQARSALEAARSTRTVRAFAAAELDAAEQALERALAALDAERPRSEIGHLAYMADRRAAIAQMYAQERRSARALSSLSATYALILDARALEAAAAEQRTRELAQRLRRFDVRPDQHGWLLTPRERWFEAGLMPAPRAVRAIVEAAGLLGRLPDRQVVVVGYAAAGTWSQDLAGDRVARNASAPAPPTADHQVAGVMPMPAEDHGDLGCARADVVRAFLISNGVDPRRIVTACVALDGTLEAAASAAGRPPAGETAIAILPENGFAWTPLIDRGIQRAIDLGSAAP